LIIYAPKIFGSLLFNKCLGDLQRFHHLSGMYKRDQTWKRSQLSVLFSSPKER
jgi:hypothetical protein